MGGAVNGSVVPQTGLDGQTPLGVLSKILAAAGGAEHMRVAAEFTPE